MTTKLIKLNNGPYANAVHVAAEVLKRGGTLIYPTDTIYGIGADASNPSAVEKIYTIKEREKGKALLVLTNSIDMVLQCSTGVTGDMKKYFSQYWPGPVTFILNASDYLPLNSTGGKRTIGIRIPKHKFCIDLIENASVPLISTSANISGEGSARKISDIMNEFEGKVDLIIDAGDASETLPSTVADLTSGKPVILRQGAVVIE